MNEFLIIALAHFLALMSPGPDFVMIAHNSVVHSRKIGIHSALGLALGMAVHVTYSLVGIGLLISKSIVLFSVIKYLGAAYLIYIGFQSIRHSNDSVQTAGPQQLKQAMTALQAIKTGFLTNVLNPKVTLFFLALFSQVVDVATPLGIKILYGLEMSTATVVWFSFVAFVFSHPKIRKNINSFQKYVQRVLGGILIVLGLKIALTK